MTIEKLRLSSLWESTAYNGISVNAIQVKYPDSANWDVGRVPTSGDAVVIASGTCSASNWVYVGSVALSGTGRLNIGMDARDSVDEVGGGEDEFLADYPNATISLEGGQAANEQDEPLEVCRGTFRYLVGPKTQSGLVIVVR